jgi:hypothetical protein
LYASVVLASVLGVAFSVCGIASGDQTSRERGVTNDRSVDATSTARDQRLAHVHNTSDVVNKEGARASDVWKLVSADGGGRRSVVYTINERRANNIGACREKRANKFCIATALLWSILEDTDTLRWKIESGRYSIRNSLVARTGIEKRRFATNCRITRLTCAIVERRARSSRLYHASSVRIRNVANVDDTSVRRAADIELYANRSSITSSKTGRVAFTSGRVTQSLVARAGFVSWTTNTNIVVCALTSDIVARNERLAKIATLVFSANVDSVVEHGASFVCAGVTDQQHALVERIDLLIANRNFLATSREERIGRPIKANSWITEHLFTIVERDCRVWAKVVGTCSVSTRVSSLARAKRSGVDAIVGGCTSRYTWSGTAVQRRTKVSGSVADTTLGRINSVITRSGVVVAGSGVART